MRNFTSALFWTTIKKLRGFYTSENKALSKRPYYFFISCFYKQRYSAKLKVFSLFQNKYYIFFAKYKKKFFKKSFFLPQNNSKIQEIHQIINLVTYVTKDFHISDKS